MNTNLLNARASLSAYLRDLETALKEARELQSEMGSEQMRLNNAVISVRDTVVRKGAEVKRILRLHKEAAKKRHVVKEDLDQANHFLDVATVTLAAAITRRDEHQDKMADQANLVRSLEDDVQSIESALNRTAVMR